MVRLRNRSIALIVSHRIMASEWYYTSNGKQAPGPVSSSQLRELAATGRLLPTDLVWKEGMENWEPAGSIKSLFPQGAKAAEPANPPVAAAPAGPAAQVAPVVAPVAAPRDPADLADLPAPAPAPKSRGKRPVTVAREEAHEEEDDGGGLLSLPPLVVWLISFVTLGLFGLIYLYLACRARSARPDRLADSSGRPLGRHRHPLSVLYLSIFTLGFYFIFWLHRAMKECHAFLGEPQPSPRIELSLMLAFWPYAIFVAIFRLPERIRKVERAAGLHESVAIKHGYVFANPCLLPALPLLAMMEQEALNQVWTQVP